MSAVAINHLFGFPETIEKLILPIPRSGEGNNTESRVGGGSNNIPIDILESSKEYIFYLDIPGISKSDIQVTVDEERTLVIKSNGKRKRDDDGEEGSKYIRLERRLAQNLVKKFRLPEDADVSAVTAKYQDGVLTVTVGKLPPQPPKPKTVQIAVS
ncbi:PREDICTED: 17.4 kDa class III heat shock protein-like [Camelina sativa]|uniref:17.4 kDa class III heat shock protein-like n=1 Tax=Camelina sativa TaxID=90675 RepID=A0ABM0YHS7_CAMSA|nr:PREDICTED: 17.4 kDa class III heat shock protein-like [Camelina sativa]XP_010501067.1 PREDICTED: 17.4 kDa class III heat shock protein-like [Camelina sativa]